MRKQAAYVALVLGLSLGVALSVYVPRVDASRNSGGTYSLPSGNPVTTGTPISSTVHNATMADVAAEITNSLDRGGRGAMTAPLQCSNGTVGAPSLTFASDTDTGLYRAAANNPAMTCGGTQCQSWTAAASSVPGTFTVGSDAGVVGALGVSGATNLNSTATIADTVTLSLGGPSLKLKPGASNDHVYAEFYADSAAPNTRSGFVGYPTGGSSVLTLQNQMTNGNIYLVADGTGVVELGSHAKLSGGNPASTTGFTNTLTAANNPKAWGSLTPNGSGTVAVSSGFNVASVTCGNTGNDDYIVTLATGFFDTSKYLVLPASGRASGVSGLNVDKQSGTVFHIRSAGACDTDTGTGLTSFVVFGIQ